MSISPELPAGFLALTSPVASHARQLLLMIAHTTAFQEWAGVNRWQDACAFLDIARSEVQKTEHGELISNPNVLLTYPSQEWATLDSDRVTFRGCQMDLTFAAITKHESIDLSLLEFVERVGRVIAAVGQMSGGVTTYDDGVRSWPWLNSMTEPQPPELVEADNILYWTAAWQVQLRGGT